MEIRSIDFLVSNRTPVRQQNYLAEKEEGLGHLDWGQHALAQCLRSSV